MQYLFGIEGRIDMGWRIIKLRKFYFDLQFDFFLKVSESRLSLSLNCVRGP